MKNFKKKKLLVIFATLMFAGMMGLSVTTTINGTDFSLAGIEALAISGGTAYATCSGDCNDTYCEMSGYHKNGCIAGGCCDYCVCEGQDEGGTVMERTEVACGECVPCDPEEDPDCEDDDPYTIY